MYLIQILQDIFCLSVRSTKVVYFPFFLRKSEETSEVSFYGGIKICDNSIYLFNLILIFKIFFLGD